jgi:hypothetical protein
MSTSNYQACIAAVRAASGRDNIDDAELERIFERAQNRTQFYRGQGMDPLSAAQRAGTELGSEIRMAAAIERKQAAVNMLARRRLDARVIAGKEYDSVVASLTGVQRGTARGLADSVDANRHALAEQMRGGLVHDLRAAGLFKALRMDFLGLFRPMDEAFERDIARELWRQRDPALSGTGNAAAETAARILAKYQDAMRHHLNEAGAWIGKLDHYITRQSHDMLRVRGDASDAAFQAWRSFILPRLDAVTFRDAADPEQFLRNVWDNISSGMHTTSTSETLAGFSGSANLAKAISQERVLHFSNADAWFDYNQQFGRGAVLDSVVASLDKGARDVALLRTFGTNPEAMLKGWTDRLAVRLKEEGRHKDANRLGTAEWPHKVLKVLDGRATLPGSQSMAYVGLTIRATQTLAKLGGVLLSSVSDLAVNAAMLRHSGVGILEAYAAQMRGLLPRGAETREVADVLGVGIDRLLGAVHHRIGGDDGLTGRMAQATNIFFRLNGLAWWTDRMKESAGLMLSYNLARNAGRDFAMLPGRMQATLRRYGIEATEWGHIRAAPQHAADGTSYLLPEGVADTEARRKLSAYLVDQVREGMTEPTAGTKAISTWGTQAGTPEGELVRSLMQFKSFTVTYMTRSLGREFLRDGVDVGGVAHLIVATTALGYLALTLKDLAKGRNPREPDSAADYRNLVAASFVQGGGLGIYGDFLFGEANRFGGGILATLGGPTMGTAEDLHKLVAAARGEGHLAAQAIRMAAGHTPFVNLFYSRAALDYLVLHRLQEWANPGYLRRMEQRVKRENDQTFWLRPTDAIR